MRSGAGKEFCRGLRGGVELRCALFRPSGGAVGEYRGATLVKGVVGEAVGGGLPGVLYGRGRRCRGVIDRLGGLRG